MSTDVKCEKNSQKSLFMVLVDLQAKTQLACISEVEVINHVVDSDGTLTVLSDSSGHIIHFKLIILCDFSQNL